MHRGWTSTVGLLVVLWACGDEPPAPSSGSAWSVRGAHAPYELTFDAAWRPVDLRAHNRFAEVSAEHEAGLTLMVLPQPHDAERATLDEVVALKDDQLRDLRDALAEITVRRQGPIYLDGGPAFSILADARDGPRSLSLALTYLVRDGWSYQIVAWAPREARQTLHRELDRLLSTWQGTAR